MTDEQLAAVRCYTSAEAVKMLNCRPKWLKDLVRERRVPHQRTGRTKGVWFTAEDILKIGEMLPELMSHRTTGGGTTPADGEQSGTLTPRREPSADQLAEWAQLTAHQRRPRRPTA